MANQDRRKPPSGSRRTAAQTAAREEARAKARQLQLERIRRERRRRLLLTVGAPVLVVVLVIVGFIVVKANQSPAAPAGSASTPAGAELEAALNNVPAAAFDTVGTGSGVIAPTVVTGDALTANGLPRVLYIGAEFCPYCAAERWAVITALSRFGTFSNLGVTTSSASDIYPSTATLSFHGATYTSTVLSFTGVESTTNIPDSGSASGYQPLDALTAADQEIDTKYNPKGSIPFVDFGNRYVITGASYDASILRGRTQAQIAADLSDPTSAVAVQVLGAANMMSAVVCTMTNNQPANVCGSTAVTSQKLPG